MEHPSHFRPVDQGNSTGHHLNVVHGVSQFPPLLSIHVELIVSSMLGLGVYFADPAPSRSFPIVFSDGEIVYPQFAYPLRNEIIPIYAAALMACKSRLPTKTRIVSILSQPPCLPALHLVPQLTLYQYSLHPFHRLPHLPDSRSLLLGCQQCYHWPPLLPHHCSSLPGLHQVAHWRSASPLPCRLQACHSCQHGPTR